MEIGLSPELAAVVQRDMASGQYASVEEYIAEAVEVLHERARWQSETVLRRHRDVGRPILPGFRYLAVRSRLNLVVTESAAFHSLIGQLVPRD